MPRRKHQKKEVEAVLRRAEAAGWTVETPPKRYFKVKCPCAEKHQKWVALTPSSGYFADHLLDWLRKQPCWEEEGR